MRPQNRHPRRTPCYCPTTKRRRSHDGSTRVKSTAVLVRYDGRTWPSIRDNMSAWLIMLRNTVDCGPRSKMHIFCIVVKLEFSSRSGCVLLHVYTLLAGSLQSSRRGGCQSPPCRDSPHSRRSGTKISVAPCKTDRCSGTPLATSSRLRRPRRIAQPLEHTTCQCQIPAKSIHRQPHRRRP